MLILLVCLGFLLNTLFSQLAILIRLQDTYSNESRAGLWAFSIANKMCQFLGHIFELQALMLYLQLSCNVMKSNQEVCLDSSPNHKVNHKSSPKKFTKNVHPKPKSSPKKFTQIVHPKSSPKKFTIKVHQKSTPKKFTNKVHQ